MKKILILACLFASSLLAASNPQFSAAVKTAYQQASSVAICHEPTTEVKIYNLIKQTTEARPTLVEQEALRKLAVLKMERDDSLRALEYVLYTLSLADVDSLPKFLKAKAAFKATFPKNELLAYLNINSVLKTCTQCRGKNIATVTCPSCKNSGRCVRCKGRGKIKPVASFSSTSSAVACPACKSSGRCSKCQGAIKACTFCKNTGRLVDFDKLTSRINEVAMRALPLAQARVQSWLDTQEQSARLAKIILSMNISGDLTQAADELKAALSLNTLAHQLPQAQDLLNAIRTKIADDLANADAIVIPRGNITRAIQSAQLQSDTKRAIAILNHAITANPTADNLQAAKIALKGFEISCQQKRTARNDQLLEALARIKQITDPETALAQLALLSQDAEQGMPARLEITHYQQSLQKQISEESSTTQKLLYYGGVLLAIIIVAYLLISTILTKAKEAARKKRRQAIVIPSRMRSQIPDEDPFTKR